MKLYFKLLLVALFSLSIGEVNAQSWLLYDDYTFPKDVNISLAVGSINASSGTSPSGAATYTIPIKCPPGTNGMVPDISLVYNSQGGRGLLGQGWSVTGLSVITRSGKDIYHDGKLSPAFYTNEDAFLLDGARLSVMTGSNGADLATYRTEAESYSVTTSYGSFWGGPLYFNVVSKDGTIMQYGNTEDSRLMGDDGKQVMMWRLNRIIDINGNYIDFEYDNADRESRIYQIRYTGNIHTGLKPYNYIEFSHGSSGDNNFTFDGGNTLNQSALIGGIRVGVISGDIMTQYIPTYGENNSKTYLKKIVLADGDGGWINETRFKYGNETANFSVSASNINIPYVLPLDANLNPELVSGDFDGDGKSEVLVAHYNLDVDYYDYIFNKNYKDFTIYKQTVSGTSSDTYSPLLGASDSWAGTGKHLVSFKQNNASKNFVVSDFDGDGKDDLFFFRSTKLTGYPITSVMDGTTIYYSRVGGSGFYFDKVDYAPATVSLPYGGQPHRLIGQNKIVLGDFDGDKRTDYLYFTESASWYGGVNNYVLRTFVSYPGKGEMNQLLMQSGTHTPVDISLTGDLMSNDLYVLDFDGDGKSELMIVAFDRIIIYKVQKSDLGHYYLEHVKEDGYPRGDHHDIFGIGDFNGDGKDDLITREKGTTNWEIGYSTGKKFKGYRFDLNPTYMFQDKCADFPADRLFIGDYNGDGKSDLLHESSDCGNFRTKSTFNLYHFKGIGLDGKLTYDTKSYAYANKAKTNTATNITPIITDVNGDGKNELSFKTEFDTEMQTLYFNKDSKAHLLEKVSDGFNRTTEFKHEPLTKGMGTFYTKGTGENYPVNNSQYPLYVVTAMKTPNGIGGINTTNFQYENMRLHRVGRGMLGFEKMKTYNLVEDTRTESIYDLNRDFYVSYLKTSKTFLNSTGVQLSQSDDTVKFEPIIGAPPYCYKQEAVASTSLDLLKGVTTTTKNSFDAHGNLTASTSTTTGGSLTQTSTTTTTYAITGGSTIANRPIESISTNKRGTMPSVSTITDFTYDAQGRMLTTRTRPYPITTISNLRYVTTTNTYDNYGNISSFKKQGFSAFSPHSPITKYEYDDKGRFVTVEENPLKHKKRISTHKFWGKPLSVIDYNGLTTTYTYDSWGKLTTATIPSSASSSYTISYSDGWDVGSGPTANQLYYTLTQHPSAPDVMTWYDYLGRAIKTKQETFGGAWTEAVSSYDARGNVASSTNNYLPSETPITTSNSYDAYNRLASSTDVFGTTSYSYSLGSGQSTTTVTLPDAKVKTTTEDAVGKLIKSSNGIAGTVHYSYDSWGNEISSGIGTTGMVYHDLIQKEYDVDGQLKKMIDKDAGTTSYFYNPFHQLLKQTDPKGIVTEYQYDTMGRLTNKDVDYGKYKSTYTYWGADKNYRLKKQTVTSTADGTISDEYDYAIGGGLTKHIKTTNGLAIEKRYTYDAYNRPSTTHYLSSNFKTKNYYDANSYLQKITTNFTSVPSAEILLYEATAMNGNGQVTNYKRVDGLPATTNYYNGIVTGYYTPGIQDLSMDYDYTNGNLKSRYDNISQTKEEFEYDAIDRLTKSAALDMKGGGIMHLPIETAYQNGFWGSFGQIASKSDVGTYSYSGFPRNAVKSLSDPASIISHGLQKIEYNQFHKARIITEDIGGTGYEEKFVYDANENRAYSQQTQGGATLVRQRWYDGDLEIDQKNSPGISNTDIIHYITSPSGLCGIVVRRNGGGFSYHAAYTDHLGSIVALTDMAGTLIAKQSYDPWGRERNPDTWGYGATWTAGTTPPKPDWLYRGYTGHEMLPEYGLINMNGRMYDPANGRMMRPDNYVQDPLNSQSYNRYSYCWNNPLKYTDPSGDLVWALPHIGISRRGLEIGLTAGIGLPGVLSAQAGLGYSSSAGGSAFVGATVSGVSGRIGWGAQSGFNASVGVGLAMPGMPGFGSNLTSASVGWSQNGGLYASALGFTVGAGGAVSFDPSLSYSYGYSQQRKAIRGGPSTADIKHTSEGYLAEATEIIGYRTINHWGPAQSNGGNLADAFGQLINAGGVVYGGAEMGLQGMRNGNAAQVIGRATGFGTQQTAQALRGTIGVVSKVGKGLGVGGYGLQVVSTGYKLYNGQSVGTAEAVGLGISTVFVGAGVILAGTAAAPFVAAGALIYGAGQLGSYIYNGNTLEENYFGK